MKELFRPSYRVMFWAAVLLAVIAVSGWFYTWHFIRQSIDDPRLYNPHRLSQLRDINYPFTVEVYGYKYQGTTGDVIDDWILGFGAFEKDILFFMRDYVRARNHPDAVFLDVGACEGQHSLFMSRLVKEVHAFEPFPPVAERFRRMIALNGFSNIHLHEVGLGDKESLLPFHPPGDQNMGNGTYRLAEGRTAKPTVSLRVVVGDDWLEPLHLSPIELVKLDVEGYEEFVLTGLSATLKRDRPVLVIEVSRPPLGTIDSLQKLMRILPDNYRFLRFGIDMDQNLKGTYRLLEIDRLPASDPNVMLLAYPNEREPLIPRGSRRQ